MPTMRSSDFRAQLQESNITDIYWGIITGIDPEKQVMTVKIPALDGVEYADIPINQSCSIAGYGIRMIPVPNYTYALLHYSLNYDKRFYHLGYFNPDLSNVTQNQTCTKEGQLILQRYLKPGEIQLITQGNAELYLSNNGLVLLKTTSGNFLKLNDSYDLLEGFSEDFQLSLHHILVSKGRVRRIVDPTKSNIPEILRDEEHKPHIEYRVDVGYIIDSTTGGPYSSQHPLYHYDTQPYIGSFTIGSCVFNQDGTTETILPTVDTPLNVLLKLASGVKIGVDELGNVYVVNSATNSYIKFTCGKDYQGNEIVDKTEVEFHINKSVTKITEFGELQYSNTYDKDGNNGQVSLSFTKKGEMSLELSTDGGSSKNIVEISEKAILLQDTKNNRLTLDSESGELHIEGSSGSLEKSILGETLKTVIEKLIDTIVSHNHPTGVGPSGPPINASQFTAIKSVDVPTILSQKVKNN